MGDQLEELELEELEHLLAALTPKTMQRLPQGLGSVQRPRAQQASLRQQQRQEQAQLSPPQTFPQPSLCNSKVSMMPAPTFQGQGSQLRALCSLKRAKA